MMGTLVTTFNGWVGQLWELFGDGRAIIDSIQRSVALQWCFDQTPAFLEGQAVRVRGFEEAASYSDDGERAAPGFVLLADACVRQAAGVREFEEALTAVDQGREVASLSAREQAFLAVIAQYKHKIAAMGLIELGDALAYLSRRTDVFTRPTTVLMVDAPPLSWQQRAFLSGCERVSVVVEYAAGAHDVAEALQGVTLQRAQTAGAYAQPGLIVDLVRAASTAGSIVVTSARPLALYEDVAESLARDGIVCAVQTRGSFADTAFGRAFIAMLHCLSDEPWNPHQLSDALTSPFSGLSLAQARDIDTQLRANRLADRTAVLAQLRAFSDTFSQLEEIASDADADVLLGVFETIAVTHQGWSDAYRREQLAAIEALRHVMRAARAVGLSVLRVAQVLPMTVFDISRANCADAPAEPQVLITAQGVAARFAPQSCVTLVMADMNSESYPVADKDDAASTLFEKLGLHPVDTALGRARRDFRALLQLPTERIVFQRSMHDANAEDTYPCAVLEEFLDACERRSAKAHDASAGVQGAAIESAGALVHLPALALPERGEELLYENATAQQPGALQPVRAFEKRRALSDLAPDDVPRVLLRQSPLDRRGAPSRGPSPSQTELYLECPFKWFALRRLNIDELDEGFGALERGNYAHVAFERFYRAFQERGYDKVTVDTLEEARQTMRDVLTVLRAEQELALPGSGRLVASTRIEQRDLESFEGQLVDFLSYEARLLPNFHPAYMEYAITADQGVIYAGHTLVGKVDRIDVDDEGNAVVIDYKGSVGKEHEIAGKTVEHMGKVQTRIYAQAIRRALGLNVVGAFYVSYGKRHALAGAYDPTTIYGDHMPYANLRNCACATADGLDWTTSGALEDEGLLFSQLTFPSMLDATEAAVETALERMERGDIACAPSTTEACQWCTVAFCPKRGE